MTASDDGFLSICFSIRRARGAGLSGISIERGESCYTAWSAARRRWEGAILELFWWDIWLGGLRKLLMRPIRRGLSSRASSIGYSGSTPHRMARREQGSLARLCADIEFHPLDALPVAARQEADARGGRETRSTPTAPCRAAPGLRRWDLRSGPPAFSGGTPPYQAVRVNPAPR